MSYVMSYDCTDMLATDMFYVAFNNRCSLSLIHIHPQLKKTPQEKVLQGQNIWSLWPVHISFVSYVMWCHMTVLKLAAGGIYVDFNNRRGLCLIHIYRPFKKNTTSNSPTESNHMISMASSHFLHVTCHVIFDVISCHVQYSINCMYGM